MLSADQRGQQVVVEAGRPVTLEVRSLDPVSVQFGADGPIDVAERSAPAEEVVLLQDGEELKLSIVEPEPVPGFALVRARAPN